MLRFLLEILIVYLYLMYINEEIIEQLRQVRRRWWVRPDLRLPMRELNGAYMHTFLHFKHNNTEQFYNFVHMSVAQFQFLYQIVRPRLVKRSWREPLDPQLRLAITLQ